MTTSSCDTARPLRVCAHGGCERSVKKATAKYCSVACCASDPERLARLRARSRAGSRTVLPMSRQLTMPFAGSNAEAVLASLCEGREDAPLGMARLVV